MASTSTSLAKIGLIRCGREVTGALPSGTELSKGIRKQEQNKNIRKFADDVA